MYCSNCGVKLNADAKFCSHCGTAIETATIDYEKGTEVALPPISNQDDFTYDNVEEEQQEGFIHAEDLDTNDSYELPQNESDGEEDGSLYDQPQKRPKKLFILLALAAVIVATLFACFGISQSSASEMDNIVINAEKDENGWAYIPLMNGEYIEIGDEVRCAALTPNGKYLAVLDEEDELRVTDIEIDQKFASLFPARSLGYISDEGLIYASKFGDVGLVRFPGNVTSFHPDVRSYVVAPNTLTILYVDNQGDVYTASYDSTGREKVASYSIPEDNWRADNRVVPIAVSDDASISVWDVIDGDTHTIVLNDGKDRVNLHEGELYSYTGNAIVRFSYDQKMLVITSGNSNTMWIKTPGYEPVEVSLGDGYVQSQIFTQCGKLEYSTAKEASDLYLLIGSYSGEHLYHISKSGDRERLISDVSDFVISNGNIIYTTEDSELFYSSVDRKNIGGKNKIANDVIDFYVSADGQYVYYIKDTDSDAQYVGALYCYKIGDDDSIKIASDATFNNTYWTGEANISIDGKTIYYMTDVESVDSGDYTEQGTLMSWSFGDDTSTRIASEVICRSVTSGVCYEFRNGACDEFIDPEAFIFLKYNSVDNDNVIDTRLMFYDGKETSLVLDGIVR